MLNRYTQLDIERMLPLLAYENDILVSKTGDMTALFEVELPEIFSSGMSDFDNLHQMWVRAMQSLPDDTIVHKQDVFVEKRFKSPDSEGRTFLSAASDRHFDGRRFLDHKCYLYITQCPHKNMRTKASGSPLNIKGYLPAEGKEVTAENDFEASVAAFIGILSENGVVARRLTEQEVIGDETRFGVIENYLGLTYEKKSVLQDMSVDGDYFKIGDNYVSMFAISDVDALPMKVYTYARHNKFSSDNLTFAVGYPSSLCLALGFSHIYNQLFFIENTKDNLREVEVSITRQRAFSAVSRENAVNMEFNEAFLDDISRKGQRTVRCSFNLISWNKYLPDLLRNNNVIAARLANMDITATRTLQLTPQMFWGCIPGAASLYPCEMTFLTAMEQGCCFINNETNYHTSRSGFGIRMCDRISGIPINVDISDEPLKEKHWIDNRNKFILGPSGSGKSFFTNHMVRQYWEQGTHVVIVDVGDSYLGLCKQIQQETGGRDGVYYTYKEDAPIRFNPFYVADGVYTTEKREQLSNLVFVLWKGEHGYSKTEETHVSTAINTYIDKHVLTGKVIPSFNTFYEFLTDESEGFKAYVSAQRIRLDNFDVDDLIQVLRPYYKGGQYDYLLNATENLNMLDKRFIVFEIDNIKDHPTLFPVVTLVLMDTFLSKMRHPSIASERKMILIEEAWKAISRQGTAEFIKYLYKTVRKHFGEAIVVTQEVDDIVSNPIVKEAIISNADCKILLDQRKYQNKFEIVQTVLALTDKEKAIALSVNKDIHHTPGRAPYKEVFITLNGNHSAVYAVEVSREEYLTYTTEKREKERLYAYERRLGSMERAIKEYISEERRNK